MSNRQNDSAFEDLTEIRQVLESEFADDVSVARLLQVLTGKSESCQNAALSTVVFWSN